MPKRIKITKILAQTGEVAQQLQSMHFSNFKPPVSGWAPVVNAFACEDRFEVCMDLAGVNKKDFDVLVEPGKLTIRGERHLPRPCSEGSACKQVLLMEIENGPFQRVLSLPTEVDPDRVTARQDNGLLWITLHYQTTIEDHA